jgi:hypothetical protein
VASRAVSLVCCVRLVVSIVVSLTAGVGLAVSIVVSLTAGVGLAVSIVVSLVCCVRLVVGIVISLVASVRLVVSISVSLIAGSGLGVVISSVSTIELTAVELTTSVKLITTACATAAGLADVDAEQASGIATGDEGGSKHEEEDQGDEEEVF